MNERRQFVPWLAFAVLASALSCSGVGPGGEEVARSRSALASEEMRPALGFESTAYWSSSVGSTWLSTTRTQGSYSLAVQPSGYTVVTSVALRHTGVIDRISFDLNLPTSQPNPWWFGDAQLYIEVPSLNTGWAYLGLRQLTGLPLGAWSTLAFDVPPATRALLAGKSYDDLIVRVVLNVPNGAATHLLDDMRLTGASSGIALKTDYRVLVLHFNPRIRTPSGTYVKMSDYFNEHDPRLQAASSIEKLRRASGGQLNVVVAEWREVDGFPPDTAPDFGFTPDTFLTLCPGGDCPRWVDVDYLALYSQYNLKQRVESGDLDGVVLFTGRGTSLAEASMAGRDPFWLNGAEIQVDCNRRFAFFMGFCLECWGHAMEGALARASQAWPRVASFPLYNTVEIDDNRIPAQPDRTLVQATLNRWENFALTESQTYFGTRSSDPNAIPTHDPEDSRGSLMLVSPGNANAGNMHDPPNSINDYGFWPTAVYFDGAGDVDQYLVTHGGDWHIDVETGRLAVSSAAGARALVYPPSIWLDPKPPVVLANGEVAFDVQVRNETVSSIAGLLVRALERTSDTRAYYVGLDANRDQVVLAKLDHGFNELRRASRVVDANRTYHVRVRLLGGDIKVFVGTGRTPVLSYVDPAPIDQGGIGFATYGTDAFFDNLTTDPAAYTKADAWYRFPDLSSPPRLMNPREWAYDTDWWDAWWFEHLPKNPGLHDEVDAQTGARVSGMLNTWWPFLFDPNRFDAGAGYSNLTFPAADTTRPNPVSRVAATSGTEGVYLGWSEPADNVGVTFYDLYRNGALFQRTPKTAFYDTDVDAGATYSYSVRARDGSGNVANASPAAALAYAPGLANGQFELGTSEPLGWYRWGGYDRTQWAWEAGSGRNGSRAVRITEPISIDARWSQDVTGLVPSATYRVSGWIKGLDIVSAANGEGASLARGWTWERSPSFVGTFDWTRTEFTFVAPDDGRMIVECRLGFWDGEASGTAWFDDIVLERVQ